MTTKGHGDTTPYRHCPRYNCIFSTCWFATLPFFVKTSNDLRHQRPLRLQEMQDSSIFSFKPDELQQQQQEETFAAIAALPVPFCNIRESVQSRHQRHSAVTHSTPQLALLKTPTRKDRKRAEPLKRATCRWSRGWGAWGGICPAEIPRGRATDPHPHQRSAAIPICLV